MKGAELQMLEELGQGLDNFDYADAQVSTGNGQPAALTHQKGNPNLGAKGAQFALNNYTFAYTVSSGAFTRINFSSLPADAVSALFFFGNSDFQSGYSQAKQLVPLPTSANYAYGVPFVFGYTNYPVVNVNGTLTPIDSTVNGVLRAGDVVVPITVRVSTTDYVILSVHRCAQVEYATLLQANISNSMFQKGIRYILQDETTAVLAQFNNPLYNFTRSWLGRFEKDSTDINSNNQPTNFRKNIVDVPLTWGITKSEGLVSAVTLSGITGNSLVINFSTFVTNNTNPQK